MSNRPVRPTAGRSTAAPAADPVAAGRPLRGAVSPADFAEATLRRVRGGAAATSAATPAPTGRLQRGAAAAPVADVGAGRPESRASVRSAVAAATPETATKTAEDKADKPRDMVSAVEELAALLIEENNSLRQHKLELIRDNVERKQQLTRAYMQQMIAFRKNPQLVDTLSAERRATLKECVERLKPLITENGLMLKAKMDSINRFMGVVVDAVRDQKTKGAVIYGTRGVMDESHTDHRHMAVAVNQEL
jgi:flagellar biosynthesis/type III secretory pathway chaperone